MAPTYDRRVNARLLAALAPGGWARELVEYGVSRMWGLDLRLRSVRGKNDHATLYVGTTKVLDLYVTADGLARLHAAKVYRSDDHGWRAIWDTRQPEDRLAGDWPAVSAYLHAAIANVVKRGTYLKEGVVQGAIGNASGSSLTFVDREAVVAFASEPEKSETLERSSRRWFEAVERQDPPAWWRTPPRSTECDLLALDRDGRLLTVEVKPADAGATAIAWSPLQARQYADQFQSWIDSNRVDAPSIIAGMLDQQMQIGMLSVERPVPALDVDAPVVPVVALDRRAPVSGRRRMDEVDSHFRESGHSLGVHFYSVDLIGRVSPMASILTG